MALLKLRALVTIGATVGWFKSLFLKHPNVSPYFSHPPAPSWSIYPRKHTTMATKVEKVIYQAHASVHRRA